MSNKKRIAGNILLSVLILVTVIFLITVTLNLSI